MINDDDTRKGSTPISISLVIELGASLVWRVLKTRCPVNEALIAISPVSPSLISPTITISGLCRKIERRAPEKVMPISVRTGTWVIPATWYSTGSSTVIIFFSGVFNKLSIEYKVVDLPLPVGPVTRIMPYGFFILS